MSVERKIDQILALPSGQQLEKLCSFVEELVCGENIQHINDFLTYLFNSNISQQVCKQCILHYLKHCSDMVEDARVEINQHIVQLIKNRNISDGYFDEIDKIVRNSLFDYYLLCEDHSLAASYLSGINIESRTVPYSVYDKIDILIKIAECYLMTKDTIEAEIFVNKASNYITDMDNEAMNSKTIDARATVLHLRFRSTHAQVLDGNKKFIDASLKYYELSRVKSHTIDEEDILQLLGKAVTCVILGKISMQRSRILSMLINDPRIHELEALDGYKTHYFLLSKIYKQQIVRENDLMEFESTLDIHQKALSIDGKLNLFHRAIVEHNIFALSKLYQNIYLTDLYIHIHTPSNNLDDKSIYNLVCKMINEGKLHACIDEMKGILYFHNESEGYENDIRIGSICKAVAECAIQSRKMLDSFQ